jgi:hypothetical protein
MSENIKKTDQQLHDLAVAISSEQKERDIIELALQIHQRKHGGFSEDKTKDMLKYLELAGLISNDHKDMIIKKLFTE